MDMSLQKFVLTGGARSGKTAILLALEQMGETIIREVAADLIELEQARGITEPWKHSDFQRRIFDWQIRREKEAENAYNLFKKTSDNSEVGRVFIDRGLIDGIAYCQLDKTFSINMDANKIMCQIKPYAGIFLVKNLQDPNDTKVRRETVEQALKIEQLQGDNYRACRYKPFEVPVGDVDSRARLILDQVNNYDKSKFRGLDKEDCEEN
jgi:predicted ATPase